MFQKSVSGHFGEGEIPYELYEDAGDGYGYEQGEFTVREVRLR
ncbi:MAG: DUF5110 domain-containing protein [Lachnospiraceae bacterium]|nr:DUF5110 domain-containing protein [Lachnospiraceae bacterium]